MSKLKEVWAFQEQITSAKLNQMILDDIRAGRSFMKAIGAFDPADIFPITLHWQPYNPAKSVYDRWRIIGNVEITSATAGIDYSLDTGGSWVSLGAGTSLGVTLSLGDAFTEVSALALYWDIDLSVIASTELLGMRVTTTGGFTGVLRYNLSSMFYLSTDDPF